MIELYEGVPGSGKSYHGVSEKFLPWVRKGRRLYIYVDGIYPDRLSVFTGIPVATIQSQMTVWADASEVLNQFAKVEPGSAVIIDEAQTVFRALQKVDAGLLRWLETHRHYGVDILLMCQDYRQMASSVTRLVEATTKFRKLAFVGLATKYQGKVRGNPEDEEIIRAFVGTYSPSVYAYYSSYAHTAVQEEKRAHSVWKSGSVAVGVAAGLFALAMLAWRPWSSLGSAAVPVPKAPVKGAPHAPMSLAGTPGGHFPMTDRAGLTEAGLTAKVRPLVRIIGGGGIVDGPVSTRVWRYVLETGEILTAAQIAGRYGLQVSEVGENGIMRLLGEGVTYDTGGD
jgi:zona occludens toxin